MTKFEQLELFVEVYHAKSITKAASNLFVTQQSLSHSIKKLEQELGQKLFDRTAKGVRPTEAGNRLYTEFYPIVTSYRNAMRDYVSKSTEDAISFVVSPAVIRNLTPNVLLGFFKQHPIITIEMKALQDEDFEKFVNEDTSQFGIITSPECILKEKYEYIVIKQETEALLVHNDNPLSKMSNMFLSALKNEHFLGITGNHYYIEAINKTTEKYGFKVTPYFESDDVENLLKLVEYGTGVMLCRNDYFNGMSPKNCTLVPFAENEFDVCTAFVFQDYSKLPKLAKSYISFLLETVKN